MPSFLESLKIFVKNSPKLAKLFVALAIFYIFQKIRNERRYKEKHFCCSDEIKSRAVLISGCDSGFGHDIANKLHSIGFCVIATVLRQESANKFNKQFNNENSSISYVMDITKINQILDIRNKVEKHLNLNNKTLWGLVNNAGMATVGSFEMITPKYLNLYTNVLLIGHMNVTREFLPLIEGRKNYQPSNPFVHKANGGRIINIASASIHLPSSVWLLYGSLKSAMTYWSHALRYELSPRFGIYCSAVEPGAYATNIWNVEGSYSNLKNDIDEKVWNIYETDDHINRIKESKSKLKRNSFLHKDLSDVINSIVHGLTAKYPQKTYRPGWDMFINIITRLPMDTANAILTGKYVI